MPNKDFKIKELKSDRLILRKFTKEDFDFIKSHFTSERVNQYLYDNEPPSSDKDVQGILGWVTDFSSGDHMRWGIALRAQPEILIGTCGFHGYDQNNNAAEIGYDLASKYHRKGYMSEALKEIIKYGFEELHLHKVSAAVYVGNSASNKLLEKLGFKLEGIIRDKHYFRGEYFDHNLYSLLETEKENII